MGGVCLGFEPRSRRYKLNVAQCFEIVIRGGIRGGGAVAAS